MKPVLFAMLLNALFGTSCSSTVHTIFDLHKTPHEAYAEKIDDKGLDKTPEGRAWLAASEKALQTPQTISLPYRQQGYFHSDKSRALGLQFNAKFGERITFNLTKKGTAPLVIYADVFRQSQGTATPLLSSDTTKTEFSFDANETGLYVLRLQPELYQSGAYNLTISVGPSLGFPVSGNKGKPGSFWGDSRDGGKRRHEGIDIFAPKRTPVVASAEGYITGVREGGLGGKVVWLRPDNQSIFLYYAHLDEQWVREGQSVRKGDTLGLVGNTGNARYTPSHLHFGVYTFSGPVDPLPFVNRTIKTPPAVPDKNLAVMLKLTRSQKTKDGAIIKANTLLVPVAATAKEYIAELPDGNLLQAPFTSVQVVNSNRKSTDAVAITTAGTSKGS